MPVFKKRKSEPQRHLALLTTSSQVLHYNNLKQTIQHTRMSGFKATSWPFTSISTQHDFRETNPAIGRSRTRTRDHQI